MSVGANVRYSNVASSSIYTVWSANALNQKKVTRIVQNKSSLAEQIRFVKWPGLNLFLTIHPCLLY